MSEFLAYLRSRGLVVSSVGGKVFVAPRGTIMADDADYLRQHKDEVLAALWCEDNAELLEQVESAHCWMLRNEANDAR
jgi:hypothetical protein